MKMTFSQTKKYKDGDVDNNKKLIYKKTIGDDIDIGEHYPPDEKGILSFFPSSLSKLKDITFENYVEHLHHLGMKVVESENGKIELSCTFDNREEAIRHFSYLIKEMEKNNE